jgi:PIN domain nuclease of toxin-antitoxin system
MRTFLDTHAWMWWVTDDRRLSDAARKLIRAEAAGQGVWISAISIWEVAKKVEKKQLVLDRPFREWLHAALGQPGLFVEELGADVLVDGCDLPGPFHGDPADQMIVATVRRHKGRLITRDAALRKYPHLKSIW